VAIEPGSSLLHYRIVEKIGEGGMGVVWKGVDTTLDREVAIKVLPEAFAGQPERLARFEREARVLAALSHPNIAGIYGLHEKDGTRFLAMEMVPGEELAARIARGPIPQDVALAIGLGIASALEAAHAAGVVHRDLKPANVKVTPEGKVKVLDFGLAKALAPDPGARQTDASLSPTMTSVGSIAGMILGTAAYMSPEQARGQAADARADVWAFGVVLYEMLSGKKLFEGRTVSDILASVLKTEPCWSDLPAATPPGVRRLLRRCLAKDPETRLHHIADARLEIQEAMAGGSPEEVATAAAPPVRGARARLLPWAVAALALLLAVLSLWLGRPFSSPEPRPVLSLAVPFPQGTQFSEDQQASLAISPTGDHLAVILIQDGVRKIFLRALDRPGMAPLGGTENAHNPFFSPDGRWLGFLADGKIRKVPVDGGKPLTISDAASGSRGVCWGSGDVIVFSPANNMPLMMIPAGGGTPTPITTLDEKDRERTHRWPQVMPGGDVVLFTVGYLDSSESYDESPIDAVRISTGERKRILAGASFARYVGGEQLLFARGGFLFAVPFDPVALQTRGTPVPVIDGVLGSRNSGIAHMDASAGGLLAFIPGEQTAVRRVLTWVNADGTRERLAAAEAYSNPSLSPDGRRIVFTLLGDKSMDVWIHDIERETTTRLTFKGNNLYPIWSPDGRWITFSSDRDGHFAVYRKPGDGSGEAELLLGAAGESYRATSWSPDGRHLAVVAESPEPDIRILSLEEDKSVEFLATEHKESNAAFSPDGRWIAYESDESSRDEIYVRPFPGPGGKWQVSADGGTQPYWSRDGTRIFFRDDDKILGVEVESDGGGFRAGRPRDIVGIVDQVSGEQTYSVDQDGRRFLILTREDAAGAGPDRVVVVVNWFDWLRPRR